MTGLDKALRAAVMPVRDDLMDDLVAKLDRNVEAATKVVAKATKLDKELCLNCGPHRFKLRRMPKRQPQSRGFAQANQ